MLQCPICLKPFLCRYGLESHWDTCHSDEPQLCQLCHTTFSSTLQVYVHYMLTHANPAALEPEWEHLAELQQQRQKDGSSSETGFHELGFVTDFSSPSFSQIAKVWCEKNQRKPSSMSHNFNCRKCSHAFPCAEALISHLKNHPADCTVTCKSCDLNFGTRQEFEDHMIQHNTKDVVKGYSGKIGTDDNDIQDMVSKPEFMLVLGLKANGVERHSSRMSERIRENLKKAITEKKVPIGTKIKIETGPDVKPLIIQPIVDQEEVKMTTSQTKPAYLHPKPCVTSPPPPHRSLVSPHPAFPPPRIFPPMLLPSARDTSGSRSVSPGSDISRITTTSEGEGHISESNEEIELATEGGSQFEQDSRRPYQCVICEFAFTTQTQCETHCR